MSDPSTPAPDGEEEQQAGAEASASGERNTSYLTILRTTSIMGAASAGKILFGLLRTKIIAVLLGPAGIGTLGLLQNLMGTAATVAGLGMNQAGAREVAAARRDDTDEVSPEVIVARRALAWATAVLGLGGAALIWLFRERLSQWVFSDTGSSDLVGWVGLGVLLTVTAGSQGALLTGLRRIGDVARHQVSTALLSTTAGIIAVVTWGEDALVVILLALPAANFIMGHYFVSKIPRASGVKASLEQLAVHWRGFARLGIPLMFSGLVEMVTALLMRVLIQRELGADDLGQFQASWSIAATYMGFIMGTMSRDYFPRLSAKIHDPEASTQLVNEQSEVSLLLIGPMVFGLLAVTPWLIPVLYSTRFDLAAEVLRWQLLGDLFRVAGWSFSFVLLAAGLGGLHLIKTIVLNFVLLSVTWLLLPHVGVEAAGIAFLVMTALHLPLILWLIHLRIDYRWQPALRRRTAQLIVAGGLLAALSHWSTLAGALVGVPVAVALGVVSLARVGSLVDLPGRVGRLTKICQRFVARFER